MSGQIIRNVCPPPAVCVYGGSKLYGSTIVLDDLNMTVGMGTIYALLGSSGCGKTTLLSSIVGLKRLGSGRIDLFGQDAKGFNPKMLGFMPQECGLHEELTIWEEFQYFARLFGLSKTELRERGHFLLNLLRLPEKHKRISICSGGTKRRISLALTLLHKPSLLILDEPTVGVDPLLRESIWDHVRSLVDEAGVTVIVSTHYTEEARQAEKVGFMRHGKLLVEENPSTLLRTFGADLLEDVFLEVCKVSESQPQHRVDKPVTFSKTSLFSHKVMEQSLDSIKIVSYSTSTSCENLDRADIDEIKILGSDHKKSCSWFNSIRIIHAIALLFLKSLFRYPLLLAIFFMMGPFNILVPVVLYGSNPIPTIGSVNLEQHICPTAPGIIGNLGCQFLNDLQVDGVKLVSYNSSEKAKEAIHLGEVSGYLIVPHNFTSSMAHRFVFGRFAEQDVLNGSSISVGLDYSDYLRTMFFTNALMDSMQNLLRSKALSMNNETGEGSLELFKVNSRLDPLLATPHSWVKEGVASNLIMVTWVLGTVIGLFIVRDKKRGVIHRSVAAGAGVGHCILGALSSFTLLAMMQTVVNMITVHLVGIDFVGGFSTYAQVFTFLVIQGVVGVSYGTMLGFICGQELEVVVFILFGLLMAFAGTGPLASLESMDVWTQWYLKAFPFKVPTNALQAIYLRGESFLHYKVAAAFIPQSAWITFCLCAAYIVAMRGI